MSDQKTTLSASWVDAWLGGYNARRDGAPRSVPPSFTPAASREWLAGWDAADLDMEVSDA